MIETLLNKERRDALQRQYTNRILKNTLHYQKIYHFKKGLGKEVVHNNESDAFKHTFAAADTSLKEGNFDSWAKGFYHEFQPNNPVGERNMDL